VDIMNKFALIAALSAIVAGAAFAQGSKPAPKTIKCAVMPNDDVDVAKATKDKMFADYKGRRYYFCCAGCPGAFKKDPAKYAKGPSLPTPKPTKKKA
jgi:YHS domain-containing protein